MIIMIFPRHYNNKVLNVIIIIIFFIFVIKCRPLRESFWEQALVAGLAGPPGFHHFLF